MPEGLWVDEGRGREAWSAARVGLGALPAEGQAHPPLLPCSRVRLCPLHPPSSPVRTKWGALGWLRGTLMTDSWPLPPTLALSTASKQSAEVP